MAELMRTSRISRVVRLQDLACLAGCSPATASRALRDDPRISEDTKRRIWQLAHDFDFPLGKYQDLRSRNIKSLKIVIPRLPTRTVSYKEAFLLELIAHLADESRLHGVDLTISSASPSSDSELLNFFDATGPESVAVLGQGLLHDALNKIGDRKKNFVVWGARLENQNYCVIGTDNFAGGYKAASHLIKIGRNRLIFLGDALGPEMRQRYQGCLQAAEEFGAQVRLVESRLEVEAASEAILRQVRSHEKFDGIVCVNDLSAIGAINALRTLDICVPDDVSVIGYDDIELCKFVRPQLSSVSQNSIRSARVIFSKLMQDKCGAADSEFIVNDLIIRST